MEHHTRHSIIWKLLRPLARLVMFIMFGYRSPVYNLKGPYIMVMNHVTDLDPVLAGVSFRKQMYFLASEHVLRQGFVSKLLVWALGPITRQKGGSAAGAVKSMLRVLKDGGNIAFYPEGNRTWDGVTRPFPESTGKLIRSSGASLVTFKFEGGYFASPRWSGTSVRKGRLTGKIVNVYTPQQLKEMTAAQINEVIAADIHEDAYETRKKHPMPFRGKRLAEHLETYLFTCPRCNAMGRMESRDNIFRCKACGKQAVYLPSGVFGENGFPFSNVRDWAKWQAGVIGQKCLSAGDEPIFSDDGFDLYKIHSGKGRSLLAQGEITLYKDRLDLPGDLSIPLSDISGMSLQGPINLYIGTSNGNTFHLHTEKICSTEKYLEACTVLGADVGYGV